MKQPKNYVIALLTLALTFTAAALVVQRRQLVEQHTTVQTLRRELSMQVKAAARQVAEVTAASDLKPDNSPAAIPAATTETTMPAHTAATGVASSPAPVDKRLEKWRSDANEPDVMRRLGIQAQLQVQRHYGELFKTMGLTIEQADAFAKLLVDKKQVALDIAAASIERGNDPSDDPAEYRDLVAATKGDLENQIHALLGDGKYDQYKAFDRVGGQTAVVSHLEQVLRSTSAPLTPQQSTRLQQVMTENDTSRVSASVVKGARDFLAPTQLEALKDLRALQQANSKKRNQIKPVLPVTPTTAGK